MKKFLILTIGAIVTFPYRIQAQDGFIPRIESPVQEITLDQIFNRFASLLAPITILLVIVVIMVGGAQVATAGSDQDKAAKGMKLIQNALIGFAIIVLAPVIIQFFAGLFGVRDGIFIDFSQ